MSDTVTSHRPLGLEGGAYVIRGESASTSAVLPHRDSSTDTLARMTRNMMLPLLFGVVSFGTPAMSPPAVRQVFSGAAISRSAVVDNEWLLTADPFQFTEESADIAEVRALNALLHLPITGGLELDLPE